MTYLKKLLTVAALLTASFAFAQTTLTIPRNLQGTYDSGTRSMDGAPGKNYWQNRADYLIKVNFNPQTRDMNGVVDIDYENHSPKPLAHIIFKLYPNFYKKGVTRNTAVLPEDVTDGVQIKSLSVNGTDIDSKNWSIDGTNMSLKLASPLTGGQKMHFSISYYYNLNKTSHQRTGQVDSGSFFVAYFFPRVAVFDDIDGWNRHPYLGEEEFYNDFCHFNAEITVPGNYQVWATGTLKNPEEVYAPKIINLIKSAGEKDIVTDIITEDDRKNDKISPRSATHTWKFEADSVTDLVFATSDHYVWKASSLVVDPGTGRRTRVDAVFNPDHKDYLPVINYARKTVQTMSYVFPKWPYPYPHETVFDGLDQMEYPMMVNDNPLDKQEDVVTLTDHEIFHTMFPFYMGTNETKYGWMDEGWATIAEWLISPMIDPTIRDHYGIAAYENSAGNEDDMPIMTLTPGLTGVSTFTDSYPKPAFGYLYVKDMLGDERFTKALHYYISQWHGKHPMPFDFFNCMNTGAGMDMNWFWKAWFFDGGIPDLGITNVVKSGDDYTVTITMVGTKPVPVDLNINHTDGTTKLVHQSIICWKDGNKTYDVKFNDSKPIDKFVLGTLYDPDSHQEDNVYKMK